MDINIEDITKEPRKYNKAFFRKNYPEFYEHVLKCDGETFAEKLYVYLTGTRGKCVVCGDPTKFRGLSHGYDRTCCLAHAYKDPNRTQKIKQTKQEKYGDANYNNRQKFIETSQTRYGGSGFGSDITSQKIKSTCIDRYGVENPSSVEEIKEKRINTFNERYGGIGFGSDITSQKIKQTCLERYGNPDYSNREKAKQTMLIRYGISNPAIYHAINNHDDLIEIKNDQWICACPHPGCDKCTNKTYITRNQIHNDRKRYNSELCTILNPIGSGIKYVSSISQKVALELDEKIGLQSQYHLKGGEKQIGKYHLDYYIPELNIAIEFNGDYWHANPNIYDEDWYNPMVRMSAEEIWEKDLQRMRYIMDRGIDIYILWEHDYLTNKTQAIDNLVEQIKKDHSW